jgi:hypothetical protein
MRERGEGKGNLNAYYVTIFAKARETATRIALFGRNEFTIASNSLPLEEFWPSLQGLSA